MFTFTIPEEVQQLLIEGQSAIPAVARACRADDGHFSDWFFCAINLLGLELASEVAYIVSKAAMVTLIVLGVVLAFRTRIPLRITLGLWLLFMVIQDLLVPHFLFDLAIEPFWPRLAGNNTDVSTFAFLMVVTLGWLVALGLNATLRTRERALYAISATAVVMTLILFHYLYTSGAMIANLRGIANQHELALRGPPEYLQAYCRAQRMLCVQSGPEEPISADAFDIKVFPILRRHEAWFWESYGGHLSSSRYDNGVPRAPLLLLNTDTETGGPYILFIDYGAERKTVLLDRYNSVTAYQSLKTVMMLQMGVAHSVWFGGMLLTVAFHRRLFHRRLGAGRAMAAELTPP